MPELPLVGQEFAGYRIRSVIGRGGMSVVYQADNLRLGSTVALKVLAPELSNNDLFRTRFLEESRIAASLNHPNVIPIYDMGPHDDLLYIVMRYVAGTDMRALLKKKSGPMAPGEAVFLIGQAARALDAAHRKGLVHRDVKPGNFLIERGGDDDPDHVYLSDFGITKYALSRSGLTPTGEFLGTIDYVAPEQIQAIEVDGRADQYSLGCVLYECLTGRLPFQKDRGAAIIWAHVEETAPMPSTVVPELPAAIDAVIAKVMAKKAEDRYPTCRAFTEAANAALGGPLTGTGTVSRPEEGLRSQTVSAIYAGPESRTPEPPQHDSPEPAQPDRSATDVLRRPALAPQASAASAAGAGQASPPPPLAPGPVPGAPASPRSHRGRWIGAIAAAVVLIIGAGIGIFVAGRDTGSGSHQSGSGMSMKGSSSSTMPASQMKEGALDKAILLVNTSGDAKGDLPPKTCKQVNVNLVTCTAPTSSVQQAVFRTYPSLTALYSAYVAKVKSLNGGKFQQNVNNCRVNETYGEVSWNHMFQHPRNYTLAQSESGKLMDSQAVGRVFCTFTSGVEYMVWTQNDGKMLGQAYGAPHEDVWNWWVGVHHNIALGGMKMSDMNMGQ
jgi:serine/threonine-protein kinase